LRILTISPHVPLPAESGGKIRSLLMISALASEHDLDLLALSGGGDETEALRDLGAVCGRATILQRRKRSSPMVIAKLASWSAVRSEILERHWSPAATESVRGALAARHHDLVVLDSTFVAGAAPAIGRTPFVLALQNVESSILRLAAAAPVALPRRVAARIEAALVESVERDLAVRAAAVITVSEADRQRLLEIAPAARVQVVPNTVDLARLPLLPPPAPTRPLLLFVGWLGYPPNHDAAIQFCSAVMPAIRQRIRDVRGRIVGGGADARLARIAEDAGVEMTGRVDDVLPHYHDSFAVLVPMRIGGGSRIKVLEAMAVGRPLVATGIAASGLPLEDGTHFLRAENGSDFSAAIEALRRDPARVAAIVAAARRLVEAGHDHPIAAACWRGIVRSLAPERTAP
jgi:glycosyltransferase involved in cell wall biosynthesis